MSDEARAAALLAERDAARLGAAFLRLASGQPGDYVAMAASVVVAALIAAAPVSARDEAIAVFVKQVRSNLEELDRLRVAADVAQWGN